MLQGYLHRFLSLALCWLLAFGANAADETGPKVRFENDGGSATVVVESIGTRELKMSVDPRTTSEPLKLLIELPTSGPNAWSLADVEVRDAQNMPMKVRRSGIEWHKLWITIPAERARISYRRPKALGAS